MSTANVANISRALLKKVQDLGAAMTPPVVVKDSNLRDPLVQDSEDECIQFKFSMAKAPQRRRGQTEIVVGYEVHCWSKRAEERNDKKTDRHMVIASLIEDVLQDLDLEIRDYVSGNTAKPIVGTLNTLTTSLHYRDKSNRIFGSSVDYSVELPQSMQAVLVVTALLNQGVS